jgi:fibronectin-binding autotransporter adhesin
VTLHLKQGPRLSNKWGPPHTTTTGLWTDGANWSNDATSGGTTGTVPANSTTTDNVVFNQSSVNGDTIVQLSADRSIRGIVIANTGSTTLESDSATARLLTLGADGIVVNAGAGAVTVGTGTNPLNMAVSVTGSINNNSLSLVTVNSNISRTASDTSNRRLTFGGSGNTVMNGVASNGGGTGVLELFKTGTGTLTLTGANTFSGQAALTPSGSSNGTVLIGVASVGSVGAITSSAFGTGTISLGSGGSVTIAGTDSVTARTILNPIVGSNLGGSIIVGDGVNNASIEFAGGYSHWFTSVITNNLGGSGQLIMSGPVNLVDNGNRSLAIGGPGRTVITGVISNGASGFTGGLRLTGSGAVTVAAQNTYRNTTLASEATVRLGSSSIVQSGSISSGPLGTGTVSLGGSGSVINISGDDSSTKRTVANQFTFDFGTFNFGDGVNDASLEFSGLMNSLYGGTTFTNNLASGTLTFSGTLSPRGNGGQTMGFAGNGRTEVSGVIVNGTSASPTASNVTKNGNGVLVMSGQSVYTGQTNLNAGVISAQGAENIGVSGPMGRGGTIVLSGGTLQYSAANQFDYSSRFSTASNQRYNIDTNGQDVTWATALTSSGGSLTKSGSGTLVLNGVSTYTGTTTLSDGIINLGSAETAGTSGPLGRSAAANAGSIVLAGGTLQYSAANNNDYSGRFSTAADQRYNVDTNGRDVTWATALTSSGGSLTKLGSGTLTLQGNNTYSGQTTISAGVLALGVNGSFVNSTSIKVGDAGSTNAVLDLTAKTASFTIGAGQTLSGGGTVLVAPSQQFLVQGTFAPGNSPGLFTFDGGTTVLSGTTVMEIFGTSRATSPSHGAGFYDAVDIVDNGTLQFGGNLTFEFSSLFDNNSMFSLFTPASGSFLSGNFSSVTVAGSFYTGLSWEQSGTVWKSSNTVAGQSLEFNAANGQLVIVPEPAALALAGIGLGLTAWAAKRRQRRAS